MADSKERTNNLGPSEAQEGVNRRDFLNEITFAALGIAAVGSAVVTYRYLSPNVLFEPPTKFRAGSPDLYPLNSVTFLIDQQVYIVRTLQGFYAVSSVCTHLGCITAWHPEDDLIECPCHGSKFRPDGEKVAGPAPRPLPHFLISLTVDGELQVDKLETVEMNRALKV
ncbi:MAG TPA: ubiquinol-cytochrome c reductase iron-sulfur subunit [Candidatus Cybelea sp.]|nr:ubiquinol-cytochrome c reductase iron-sulfur subunit [Candidatus Cybelea sp.]